MYLDTLTPLQATVGYGALGCGGDLGYHGMRVMVENRPYEHALGTHPPARLAFDVGGRYSTFRCKVAMNDSVPPGRSHADFFVHVDGRVVASVHNVGSGAVPREVIADITGARRLELSVKTSQYAYSHAVWLEPFLDTTAHVDSTKVVDPLGRAEITRVAIPPAENCIGTVVSPGFEMFLDDMLGSLMANGNVPDARVLVFAVNANDRCAEVAAKYGATLIPCLPLHSVTASIKSVLYAMASVFDARRYVGLDADTFVTSDLRPLFSAIDALPERSILACRDGNGYHWQNLAHGFRDNYCGKPEEIEMLQLTETDLAYPFMINDGLFAASRCAMLSLDSQLRSISNAEAWLDSAPNIGWRNQFLFNLAVGRLRSGVELDDRWNVQLHCADVEWDTTTPHLRATFQGTPAHVVHFSGIGKTKYLPLQGRYANIPRPVIGPSHGDGYAQFLSAFRSWAGGRGIDVLAWSFYGTTDGQSGIVRDASVFPLFAALHYLIRSNGCVRVLEAGTARGVSAACLASAVAHRDGGKVVTLDFQAWPDRDDLWNALPARMKAAIEPRTTGSLEGMRAAIDAGERYEAALLDTEHTEEHVWAEFDLTRQLVCPGGLILIHDPLWRGGTVEAGLRRIQAAGYNVVRLWNAEGGVREDDYLGLALIENRRRA